MQILKNLNPTQKQELTFLSFLVVLAFGVRLAYYLFLQNNYFFFNHPGSDVLYYRQWAENIAAGDWLGKGTFYGLPLYPYFLAVLKIFSFGQKFFLYLAHMLLGTANCVLIYFLAKKIFDIRVAYLAAVLAAINFLFIYYDWLMMPVPLLIFLSLLLVLFLMDPDKLETAKDWFYVGLLTGLTILGDGKILIFFALILVAFRKQSLKSLFPLVLGVVLVLGSVSLRNKIVGGEWTFITGQSGLSFYVGNNKDADGLYSNPYFIRPTHGGQDEDQQIMARLALNKDLGSADISQYYRQKAFSFIKNAPLDYIKLLGKKLTLFLTDNEKANDIDLLLQREWKQKLDINPFYALCPLSLLGLFIAWKKRNNGIVLTTFMIVSQLIFILLFFLTTRHRVTILPFLIIFESFALCWLWDQWKGKNFKVITAVFFFFAAYLFVFKAVSVDPHVIEYIRYANSGPIYADRGDYKKAQSQYLLALEYQPFDTNTLYNLGNAYLAEKDFGKSEQYYKKVLRLVPFHVDATFNLAYLYEQTRRYEEALSIYKKLSRLQPQSLDIYFRIANVFRLQGQCQKAEQYFSKITAVEPSYRQEINELMQKCPSP